MILRYAANLKLAKELYSSAKPKLKGDQYDRYIPKCIRFTRKLS